jgi:hypothetical protein
VTAPRWTHHGSDYDDSVWSECRSSDGRLVALVMYYVDPHEFTGAEGWTWTLIHGLGSSDGPYEASSYDDAIACAEAAVRGVVASDSGAEDES